MRPTVQQARAALLLSICMTVLGTCGVGRGITEANQTSIPAAPPLPAPGEPPPDGIEAFEAMQSAPWIEVIWDSPYRRQLAAANAVVSGMLLIGSFLLTFRRPSALWWLRNAIAANVLWIAANFANIAWRLLGGGPDLYARIDAFTRAYGAPGEAIDGRAVVTQAVVITGILAFLSVLVHLAIAWRVHRPDVRAFIESGTDAD